MRTDFSDCDGVNAARTAEHQSVQRTHAGNCNENIQDISKCGSEYIRVSNGCPVMNQSFYRSPACDTDIVEEVDCYDDNTACNQCNRKIFLRVFQLCVDGGCDDPAFICERSSYNRAKKRVSACLSSGIGEVFHQNAVFGNESDNDADYSHESKRY